MDIESHEHAADERGNPVSPWTIELWGGDHPCWGELVRYIQREDLAHGVVQEGRPIDDARYLVALSGDELAGVLMFLVQPIGPEMDCPPLVAPDGAPLLEAKIRAFHVQDAYRNQGIGTGLQRRALQTAAALRCYQLRSWSAYSRTNNFAIKMKLGFAGHPGVRTIRGIPVPGVYWVKRVAEAEATNS